MNRVSLKVSPGSDVQALLQELAKLGPTLMFDLGPKLVSMSVKTAGAPRVAARRSRMRPTRSFAS